MVKSNNKFDDIVIDIETLDTENTAVILSIGMVGFKLNSSVEENWCSIHFDKDDQIQNHNRTVSEETLQWWKQQSIAAQEIAFSGMSDFTSGMGAFHRRIELLSHPETKFWAKSPRFDFTIIEHALKSIRLKLPWDFRQERDVRTYQAINEIVCPPRDRELILHDAASDALHEAQIVQAIYQWIHN